MSKKLIAGAGVVASFAIALAPLATFAENVTSHTDVLNLTIPAVCTLGTVTSGEPNGSTDASTHTVAGDWTNTTAASAAVGKTDTLAKDVMPGQAYEAVGTTTFTIKCNDADGYTLSAAANAANLVNGSYTIPTGAGTSADLTTDGNSYWNFKFATESADMTITNGYTSAIAVPTTSTVVVTGGGAGNTNTGDTVTVTYGAGIDAYQEAGTYTGTVVYTLAQLD